MTFAALAQATGAIVGTHRRDSLSRRTSLVPDSHPFHRNSWAICTPQTTLTAVAASPALLSSPGDQMPLAISGIKSTSQK
jgi:hypothetical protein